MASLAASSQAFWACTRNDVAAMRFNRFDSIQSGAVPMTSGLVEPLAA